MQKKAFIVTDGSGGTADLMTSSEARQYAVETTESKPNVLMICGLIAGAQIPIGFAYKGVFYATGNNDCPLCSGSGTIVIGWDDYLYENELGDCPLCRSHGVVTGQRVEAYIEANGHA